MKNSKNKKLFTYMVVGALVMALSISCKSNEEPTVTRTHSNHPPAGNYKYLDEGTAPLVLLRKAVILKEKLLLILLLVVVRRPPRRKSRMILP